MSKNNNKVIKATKAKLAKKLRIQKANVAVRVLNDSNAFVMQLHQRRTVTAKLANHPTTELHLTARHVEALGGFATPPWIESMLAEGLSAEDTHALPVALVIGSVGSSEYERLAMFGSHIPQGVIIEPIGDKQITEYQSRKIGLCRALPELQGIHKSTMGDVELEHVSCEALGDNSDSKFVTGAVSSSHFTDKDDSEY